MRSCDKGIPQVVAILPVNEQLRVGLGKRVREHLGITGRVRVLVRHEVVLSRSGGGREVVVDEKGRISLPQGAVEGLAMGESSMVALVERRGGVAVKRFEIVEEEGEAAALVDVETPHLLTRRVVTNPLPETALPKLKERYRNLRLGHDVGAYLCGRRTLDAWKSRRMTGVPEAGDEDLRRKLIEERLRSQAPDGSWQGQATITARNLRELADLELTVNDLEIRRGAQWLMGRPESEYNPGMFFATDDLVEEQAEVIKRRGKQTRGTRERFNQRKAREVGLVKAADDLIVWPCGPRITWTTALVLEPLLGLGLEDEDRVKSALWMLKACRWCGNAQQHGINPTRRTQAMIDEPCPLQKITRFEEEALRAYRNTVRGREKALTNGMTSPTFFLQRVAHHTTESGEVYQLRMPDMGGACPVVMARSLSPVQDKALRRLAEAHLWHLVSWQDPREGHFRGGRKFFRDPTIFMLDLLSRYDHPVAALGILRAVPWILRSQNEDGSWGEEPYKGSATVAVLSALKSVAEYLPRNFTSSLAKAPVRQQATAKDP